MQLQVSKYRTPGNVVLFAYAKQSIHQTSEVRSVNACCMHTLGKFGEYLQPFRLEVVCSKS
eukprot:1161000-Pelagomonas_calceolata.AAC.12